MPRVFKNHGASDEDCTVMIGSARNQLRTIADVDVRSAFTAKLTSRLAVTSACKNHGRYYLDADKIVVDLGDATLVRFEASI